MEFHMHKLLERQHKILSRQIYLTHKQQGHNSCMYFNAIHFKFMQIKFTFGTFIHSKFVKTEVETLNTMVFKIKPRSNCKLVIFLTHFSENLYRKKIRYFLSS